MARGGRIRHHVRVNEESLRRANAFLEAAKAPITLASDAHVPENVGRDFDQAVELARDAGYETVTVFEGRCARQEPLG